MVLPLGLSGPLSGAAASVDWNAAVEGVARRTIERELTDLLGDVLGGSRDDEPDEGDPSQGDAAATPPENQETPAAPAGARRATSPSGR